MSKDEKNSKAYNDVAEGNGATMQDDMEYMDSYRFWYPLGQEYADDRYYEDY